MIQSTNLTETQQTKLQSLIDKLPEIISNAGSYDELYGYQLSEGEYLEPDIRDELTLKFLVANAYDVPTAEAQLIATLKWRREFNPLSAAYSEKHDDLYNAIGLVTKYPNSNKFPNTHVVVWNLYGAVSSPKLLFQDLQKFMRWRVGAMERTKFMRWRVGAMERTVSLLDFTSKDSNQMVQIHDYEKVNFFRVDADMRKGTAEVIKTFQQNYPELMSLKFFLNVPTIVSWVYGFVNMLVAKETVKKFHMLNSGNVTPWLSAVDLPAKYGGEPKNSTLQLQNVMNKDVEMPAYAQVLLHEVFEDAEEQ
ncbi:hypothetical protein BABINDRAFT_38262 [Babjeviella inositovora NRRL Y-12698]|uniref:Phosphatidylinositol transfer protein SFH5 n=1 Tax=Babjeviella inositovora NRRL Y-12698 TaxID=984486 RepID=A0A1E3QNV3_9ASCO|nr:uncharacterized protein BABINDRAFT_38262 [Babjeviella inositovora NRRL Y-12698]ODQ79124.1 hypothetical protein BABINDRAFT_38262 [Babjeviella inositovora NRRL Y-12698]